MQDTAAKWGLHGDDGLAALDATPGVIENMKKHIFKTFSEKKLETYHQG